MVIHRDSDVTYQAFPSIHQSGTCVWNRMASSSGRYQRLVPSISGVSISFSHTRIPPIKVFTSLSSSKYLGSIVGWSNGSLLFSVICPRLNGSRKAYSRCKAVLFASLFSSACAM
ncbi:hypothetical protein DPMN_082874 [Dreissena polymorpha]|uniref:Uncharacterized protein n=1 Tax=Dreissena polymorpha TaxID=45954 RepID=A0A9D3YBL7_DREPO|nr:hypothetical protein DPMN_082874 [Dreissena polymorpha]